MIVRTCNFHSGFVHFANSFSPVHCLEAVRSSLVCYPDLNPQPYFWSGRDWHDVTVSAKVTRQCVDWEALQESLVPRDFKGTMLIRDEHAVT